MTFAEFGVEALELLDVMFGKLEPGNLGMQFEFE
jgi:hypothetical protein